MASPAPKTRRPQPGESRKAAESTVARSSQTQQTVTICIAAWLIPGLGHWRLRRRWRALILFLTITGMFVLGMLMHGTFFAAGSPSILERLGFLAELCAGLPMLAAKFFGYGGGRPFFMSADYGTAYLVCAGMLNVLSILDSYDIALARKP
jgi:hypothetical protein